MSGPARAEGFSLIEALVTLLVLAIGLLGLGQLQARLWRGSGDLHATADAFLLAHDLLEIYPIDWLPESGKKALSANADPSFLLEISQISPSPSSGELSSMHLELRWQRPSGEQSLDLTRIRNDAIAAEDTRWLMPPP